MDIYRKVLPFLELYVILASVLYRNLSISQGRKQMRMTFYESLIGTDYNTIFKKTAAAKIQCRRCFTPVFWDCGIFPFESAHLCRSGVLTCFSRKCATLVRWSCGTVGSTRSAVSKSPRITAVWYSSTDSSTEYDIIFSSLSFRYSLGEQKSYGYFQYNQKRKDWLIVTFGIR